jgi:hypothetical protein
MGYPLKSPSKFSGLETQVGYSLKRALKVCNTISPGCRPGAMKRKTTASPERAKHLKNQGKIRMCLVQHNSYGYFALTGLNILDFAFYPGVQPAFSPGF